MNRESFYTATSSNIASMMPTPNGAVFLTIDGSGMCVPIERTARPTKKRAVAQLIAELESEHGSAHIQADPGHAVACYLVDVGRLLEGGLNPERAAKRHAFAALLALALQSIEGKPYLIVQHDTQAQTTSVGPLPVQTEAEFQAWLDASGVSAPVAVTR